MLTPLPASPWLSCPRPEPHAALRYWGFPFAGGGAAAWHSWARALAPRIEMVGVRLPGRESRLGETCFTRMEALADAIVAVIGPHTQDPYVLGGHSLGGWIAYEVAHRLRDNGHPGPAALIVSGSRAPHCPRTEPDLHPLPDADFAREVHERYQGIPAAIMENPEFLELFLPALRADLTVFETYRHQTRLQLLDMPVLALGGQQDNRVSIAQVEAWQKHTSATCEVAFFPGDHFFTASQVVPVTRCIDRFLGYRMGWLTP